MLQISSNLPTPARTVHANKGHQCQNKNKKPPRTPITITTLRQLKNFLRDSDYSYQDHCMLWAAFVTAFFGFMTASEFTSPTINYL